MMQPLIAEAARLDGVAAVCRALRVSRATYYRRCHPVVGCRRPTRVPRALTSTEKAKVLEVLHAPRFVDLAPAQVQARLLDEQSYLCSVRTMYRILAARDEVRERRAQRRHPTYAAPELLATAPNQLWSWDITKLKGPATWTYYYFYVILDVYSRYIVGWMVALEESATLATQLINETCAREAVRPGQLTVHADRGSSMTSKLLAELLADLGVTKTHSRPHVSNDNPYSEAGFKTLKYRPDFPERFGCPSHARAHCRDFVDWYQHEHYHSGLGYHTPFDVHHGRAAALQVARANVLLAAHAAHPERFVHGTPTPLPLPEAVWINRPKAPAAHTVTQTAEGVTIH